MDGRKGAGDQVSAKDCNRYFPQSPQKYRLSACIRIECYGRCLERFGSWHIIRMAGVRNLSLRSLFISRTRETRGADFRINQGKSGLILLAGFLLMDLNLPKYLIKSIFYTRHFMCHRTQSPSRSRSSLDASDRRKQGHYDDATFVRFRYVGPLLAQE